MGKIEKNRKSVDGIDEKIAELLGKRLKLAEEIGKEKKQVHEPVYDPVREEEIIEKLSSKSNGKLSRKAIEPIFREIFSLSRKAQQPLKVAFLGPETSFTHSAAIKQFGTQTGFVSADSINEVFAITEKGEADFGVVPIENSLEGSVNHTYDMFMGSGLNIVAEVSLEISHNLLSKYRLRDVKKLYTNPVALAQCKEWVSKNLPKAEVLEVSSTAKSAESASLYIDSAAIASRLAAKKYGLNILAENIQDSAKNLTRFLVIGKARPKKSAKSKTSLMFSTRHKPGALFDALQALKSNSINMTKIESRPNKQRNWEYVFFVDVQGFAEDENLKKTLAEMRKHTIFLSVLGSYPEKASFE